MLDRRDFLLLAAASAAFPRDLLGEEVETVPFLGEQGHAVGRLEGRGLAGRYAFDHSRLDEKTRITPDGEFFVRTRFPTGGKPPRPWRIATPKGEVDPGALVKAAKPMGTHVSECSGNGPNRHFGLISAGRFAGVKLWEVLPAPKDGRFLRVEGFDEHDGRHDWSSPGASWIFPPAQLRDAFLATHLGLQPLSLDHGAPVRLVVPGSYGCCWIKWIVKIDSVSRKAKSTKQMREFAWRTHQSGIPEHARDYAPVVVDPAAMPVRVERRGKNTYRVVGIQWGGRVRKLSIRFGSTAWQTVEVLHPGSPASWSLWTHTWRPTRRGRYAIRLRVDDEGVRTRRLDSGYYVRTVSV